MQIHATHADYHSAEALLDAIKWARGRGGEVANGIPYWGELAGSNGLSVILMAEPGTSREVIEQAAQEVVRQRDVVRMSVMDYSERADAHQMVFALPDGREVQVQGNTAGVSWLVGGAHYMNVGERPRSLQRDWEGQPIECPKGALIAAQLDQQPVILKGVEARHPAESEQVIFQAVFEIGGEEVRSCELPRDDLIDRARNTVPAPEPDVEYDMQPGF